MTKLFKWLMKTWTWVLVILLSIAIKWISLYPEVVEIYYSRGLYPVISKTQRYLFGWVPFSTGDLFYAFLGLVILFKTYQLIRVIYQKKFNKDYLLTGLKQIIFFFLFVYVLFYGLWGLNYSRQGVASQLGLEVKPYNKEDLDTLILTLQQRLNTYAKKVDTLHRDSTHREKLLFAKAFNAYKMAEKKYPFLHYQPRSIKKSFYSPIGHYVGFMGYYNPFSGEAQINYGVPDYMHPFILTHEIGHQLGYGKEDEANFAGYLASTAYEDDDFRYSMYFDMYFYAVPEMFRFDFNYARCYRETLDTLVKIDYRKWLDYRNKKRNAVEPFMSSFYDRYLKANNQPSGKETYNHVISLLIAWYKKYGVEAL